MKHRIDDTTWIAAGDAYLKGAKVTEICRRYGMSRSAFYLKADSMGWRHPGEAATNADLPERARASVELAEQAMAKASVAIETGKLEEAHGWTGLAIKLRRMAAEEEGAPDWRAVLWKADVRDERVFALTTGAAMDAAEAAGETYALDTN